MKALSVKPPYATQILMFMKTVECRSWKTDYRGDLLICASSSPWWAGTICKNALWTPDFTEDLFEAVTYITDELGSPLAAQALFEGVCERLDSQRAMPTSVTTKTGNDGTTRYIVTHESWDVYYVIEGDASRPSV